MVTVQLECIGVLLLAFFMCQVCIMKVCYNLKLLSQQIDAFGIFLV